MNPLRIVYLLEDTDLSGGVRVVLGQADALIARGHSVAIATKGLPLPWRRSDAKWLHVDDFREIDRSSFDFVVASFWTTVPPAFEIAGPRAVHLCQGYEGTFTAYQDFRAEIEAVYRLPIPKLTVSPHLVETLRPFGADVAHVGQIIDEEFFRSTTPPLADPPRVLLVGASQIDFKGIDVGYGAAAHARWNGARFELVRVSPWRPGSDEPVEELVGEFHAALETHEMVELVHSCDVFLGPSRADEGFGLPAAEALAAGIPAILTRIPSFLSFGEPNDYAIFVDEDDAEAMGDALIEVLCGEALRRKLTRRGRQIASRFEAARVAEQLENFFEQRLREIG